MAKTVSPFLNEVYDFMIEFNSLVESSSELKDKVLERIENIEIMRAMNIVVDSEQDIIREATSIAVKNEMSPEEAMMEIGLYLLALNKLKNINNN